MSWGSRPIRSGRTKYQWLYVYGFVHPASGRNLELILPSVNADWMGRALEEFARWADPEGRKLLVVLVDNAGRWKPEPSSRTDDRRRSSSGYSASERGVTR